MAADPRSWSPRQRVLAVVIVAALVLTLAFVLTRGRAKQLAASAVPQDILGPVVLVPGYGGSTDSLTTLAMRLQSQGRTTAVLQLAGDGTGDLNAEADLLQEKVNSLMAGGAPSVDVVGYSAGGVVTRLWAANLGGASQARRIVLLGSPNHGTQVASLGAAFGGALCAVACQQLVPGSDLLDGLNEGGTPGGPQWVSLWSTQDAVVTPPDSAQLDDAVNLPVQDVCPQAQVDHGSLPTNTLVQSLVLQALATAPFIAPTPANCAALSRS